MPKGTVTLRQRLDRHRAPRPLLGPSSVLTGCPAIPSPDRLRESPSTVASCNGCDHRTGGSHFLSVAGPRPNVARNAPRVQQNEFRGCRLVAISGEPPFVPERDIGHNSTAELTTWRSLVAGWSLQLPRVSRSLRLHDSTGCWRNLSAVAVESACFERKK